MTPPRVRYADVSHEIEPAAESSSGSDADDDEERTPPISAPPVDSDDPCALDAFDIRDCCGVFEVILKGARPSLLIASLFFFASCVALYVMESPSAAFALAVSGIINGALLDERCHSGACVCVMCDYRRGDTKQKTPVKED
jgi:hypothetical protein